MPPNVPAGKQAVVVRIEVFDETDPTNVRLLHHTVLANSYHQVANALNRYLQSPIDLTTAIAPDAKI